jgi:hypothetical protein
MTSSEPVFDAMPSNALRNCGAKFGNLLLYDGDGFNAATLHGSDNFAAPRKSATASPKASEYRLIDLATGVSHKRV